MRYSYSELQQFQSCEREYGYRYEDLLEPVFDGLPRPIGGALHLGLERMYGGDGIAQCIHAAHLRYWSDLQSVVDLCKDPSALSEEGDQADTLRKINGGWKIVKQLLQYYPWRDVPDILHTEATIVVDMGHGREYIGRIDRLMNANDNLWNHDTKTSGFHPPPIIKTMRLRHQFAGYDYLVTQWLEGKAIEGPQIPEALRNRRPAGTILDLLFKPRVTFHKKNKQYTGDISVKGESYHREPLHVSDAAVSEFKGWFHTLVDRIEEQQHRGLWPKNTGHCFSFNSVCKFFEVCRNPKRAEQLLSATTHFKKREHKHEYYG